MADYSDYEASSTVGSEWLPETASSQLSNAQMQALQDFLRAFPRPRQNRVMKPRSAGNSPSSAVRRRTTLTQNAMYGMHNQYHQSALDAAIFASNSQSTRPLSWHPSARARGLSLSNPLRQPPDYHPEAFVHGLPMNGLPTESMMSYPVSAAPTFSTGYFPDYEDTQDSLTFQQETPSLSVAHSQAESATWDASANAEFSGIESYTSNGWTLDMLSMANDIPPAETTCPSYASVPSPGEMSGPSTPDFLPIQDFDDEPALTQKKAGKPEEELVGMGLYSLPSNVLGQVHQETPGKGLKLEETFSPSEDEAGDEADDEADAQGEVDHEDDTFTATQSQFSPQEQLPIAQPSNFPTQRQSSKQAPYILPNSYYIHSGNYPDQFRNHMPHGRPDMTQPCITYGYYTPL